MEFSALAFMKDNNRKRLDKEHSMRSALSDVKPRFQKLVDVNWRSMLCNKSSVFCVLFFVLF